MSMPLTRHYSPDDVRALPDDGNRYETVHGELLVTPAPGGPHQPVLMRLIAALSPYLKRNGRFAELLPSPGDISLGIDTLVQPDLFVADTSTFLHSGKWLDIRALYLVIEIVSPSSAIADRTIKRRLYQQHRIPDYWIVDIDQHQIEVWTPEAHFAVIERDRLVWRHPALEASCTVDVRKLLTLA